MAEPIRVVGIDGAGRVMSTRLLEPARVVWIRGSRWIVEMPAAHPAPPRGALVTGVASRGQSPTLE